MGERASSLDLLLLITATNDLKAHVNLSNEGFIHFILAQNENAFMHQ